MERKLGNFAHLDGIVPLSWWDGCFEHCNRSHLEHLFYSATPVVFSLHSPGLFSTNSHRTLQFLFFFFASGLGASVGPCSPSRDVHQSPGARSRRTPQDTQWLHLGQPTDEKQVHHKMCGRYQKGRLKDSADDTHHSGLEEDYVWQLDTWVQTSLLGFGRGVWNWYSG